MTLLETRYQDTGSYLKRLAFTRPAEIAHLVRNRAQAALWKRIWFDRKSAPKPSYISQGLLFQSPLARREGVVSPDAEAAVVRCADALLEGRWPVFSSEKTDVKPGVDWHWDIKGGKAIPGDSYAFDILSTGIQPGFDAKYAWQLSRHYQTSVLATAYWLTGRTEYAREAADYVDHWCQNNPFLHGVHWSSGIELGLRLISFVWIRRLLSDWDEAGNRFERNPLFTDHIYWHCWLLSRRLSHVSAASNHSIIEAAGLFVAACAMPWFEDAEHWRRLASPVLEREFVRQTFASGFTREQATDYFGLILEALFCCIIEGDSCGTPLNNGVWRVARRMVEWLADFSDCKGAPPRQGDGDDGYGLLLDPPSFDRWSDLLDLGGACFGRSAWWPNTRKGTARAQILSLMLADVRKQAPSFLSLQRCAFANDSGLSILRSDSNTEREIYCAFDAGPLGLLPTAAHGHADALAIELRYGGEPVLVDPGTYTYAGSAQWRSYFRSTMAHNTVELGGRSQSEEAGPFLWRRHASARFLEGSGLIEDAEIAIVSAEHDGYLKMPFKGKHRRRVSLKRRTRTLTIDDDVQVKGKTQCRLFFHLHPNLHFRMDGGNVVHLMTPGNRVIDVTLPPELEWRLVQGSADGPFGWYSPSYDIRVAAAVLVGARQIDGALSVTTTFELRSL